MYFPVCLRVCVSVCLCVCVCVCLSVFVMDEFCSIDAASSLCIETSKMGEVHDLIGAIKLICFCRYVCRHTLRFSGLSMINGVIVSVASPISNLVVAAVLRGKGQWPLLLMTYLWNRYDICCNVSKPFLWHRRYANVSSRPRNGRRSSLPHR